MLVQFLEIFFVSLQIKFTLFIMNKLHIVFSKQRSPLILEKYRLENKKLINILIMYIITLYIITYNHISLYYTSYSIITIYINIYTIISYIYGIKSIYHADFFATLFFSYMENIKILVFLLYKVPSSSHNGSIL